MRKIFLTLFLCLAIGEVHAQSWTTMVQGWKNLMIEEGYSQLEVGFGDTDYIIFMYPPSLGKTPDQMFDESLQTAVNLGYSRFELAPSGVETVNGEKYYFLFFSVPPL